jgi:hypothetical protein
MQYKKESNRIPIKFLNYDTEEELFEINNINPSNIGETLTDSVLTQLIKQELGNKNVDDYPDKILIMIGIELNKI